MLRLSYQTNREESGLTMEHMVNSRVGFQIKNGNKDKGVEMEIFLLLYIILHTILLFLLYTN